MRRVQKKQGWQCAPKCTDFHRTEPTHRTESLKNPHRNQTENIFLSQGPEIHTRDVKFHEDLKNGLRFALAAFIQKIQPFEVTKISHLHRTEPRLFTSETRPNRTENSKISHRQNRTEPKIMKNHTDRELYIIHRSYFL